LEPHVGLQLAGPEELAVRIVRPVAALAIVIGIMVLAGWAFDITALKSGLPHFHATSPICALILVVSGMALAARASTGNAWQYAALALAVSAFATSLLTLVPAPTALDSTLDRWLFADAVAMEQTVLNSEPGRMSDASAVLFMLIALALFLSRSTLRGAQVGFVTVATIALLLIASVLVGLLFNLRALQETGLHAQLSLPLAIGQSAAVFGVLCLRPDLGWMRLLTGSAPAAREMRSLAVGVIALPFAFAMVLQIGLQGGLYDAELRTALMVLGSIVVVFIALLMTAARLRRIDEERQRTLQAQQRVESELGLALAAAKMVGFQCDLKARTVRRFSSAGRRACAFIEEHGTHKDHLRTVHPDDTARVDAYLQQQVQARRSDYELQYRVLRPNESATWVLDKGEIRYDEQGQPAEIAGVALDVTQTVQAREALKESEERFRRLAESMPQIVYISGPEGQKEYVNRRWREYTGFSYARHEDYAKAVPEEDRDRLMTAWRHAAETGSTLDAEFRLRGADGVYRWFLTRAVPIRDLEGRIARWCGTYTDIDAQKRAHEELRMVTDHADVLLAHCDNEARFVFVNKAYTARFDCSPEDVLGKHIKEVIGEPAYERIEPYVNRALAGEYVTFEADIAYDQLGVRYMYCRYVPDVDAATGRVCGFVGAMTDVTERRQLEEQLREADQRKDEFLALLAHELRNPLAPIRYAVGLLKPGVPPEISSAAHDVIERQVAHMARLLDDLLDVSRITRDTLELRLERLDLRAVVTAAVDTVRPLFEAVNHTLIVTLPSEPAPIMGDLARLSQIIGNLLNNAAKYTEPGGRIEIKVESEGQFFALKVRDTGIGIALELLPRLFELFVQGDRTQTRVSGGLGVGLSLAKRLVEMHGGSIEADSDGVDCGSVFTVRLPSAVEAGTGEPRAVAENVLPMFQRRHQLLIVDDNLDAANSLAILAQLSGYVTHIANDGLAAIEMAEIVRPEAIIMDLGMPKMTGYEAARWVRQQPWGKDTILIAVTGWGREEDRRKSLEAGFNAHLTKPVDSSVLLNHLQQQHQAVGASGQ
jgi:PAS domain S-box-containing protein